MVNDFFGVPRYVIRDGLHPIGPSLIQSPSEGSAVAIYGFSDKPEYDLYLNYRPGALTPYPLVKGYLQNEIESGADRLHLVVVDATGPAQVILNAVTMECIVNALELKLEVVEISHVLVLDETINSYRINAYIHDSNLGVKVVGA